MPILDHGQWHGDIAGMHVFDKRLAEEIISILKQHDCQTVLDLGCGLGEYVKILKENLIETLGVDGNPQTPEITGGLCSVADIAQSLDLGLFDAVLSLEVGEHIPEEFEDTVLHNITRHAAQLVLLSWAVPGQGGYGHFNCRSNDYITGHMVRLGFARCENLEIIPRKMASYPWFHDTFMVFSRRSSVTG